MGMGRVDPTVLGKMPLGLVKVLYDRDEGVSNVVPADKGSDFGIRSSVAVSVNAAYIAHHVLRDAGIPASTILYFAHTLFGYVYRNSILALSIVSNIVTVVAPGVESDAAVAVVFASREDEVDDKVVETFLEQFNDIPSVAKRIVSVGTPFTAAVHVYQIYSDPARLRIDTLGNVGFPVYRFLSAEMGILDPGNGCVTTELHGIKILAEAGTEGRTALDCVCVGNKRLYAFVFLKPINDENFVVGGGEIDSDVVSQCCNKRCENENVVRATLADYLISKIAADTKSR